MFTYLLKFYDSTPPPIPPPHPPSRALRIVSTDNILRFTNTLIIIFNSYYFDLFILRPVLDPEVTFGTILGAAVLRHLAVILNYISILNTHLEMRVVVDRFYIALFSALEQTHCALCCM